jgi:uncharacterized repeat protein (TIGR01451 family)
MVKKILLFLVIYTIDINAGLQYLQKSIGPDLSGSANGLENVSTDFHNDYTRSSAAYDDALDEHVPIGFSFPFKGSTYSEIIISSNGILYFRASGAFNNNSERYTAAYFENQELNSSKTPYNAISPYWDDLNLGNTNDGTQGRLRYGTIGSGAGQHFVVWWDDVSAFPNNGSYSFQVVFYKDGAIKFRYKDDSNNDTDGSSATVGIKEDSSHYDQHTYNSSNINKGNDIVYRPYQHLSPITPACQTPISQIAMQTFDQNSAHPKDEYEFITLRQNNTNSLGNGYQDQINGSSNPYGSNDDYWSKFSGYIYLPDSGVYQFGVDGDDAVEVYLDNHLITGWYGGHGRHNHAEYAINVEVQAGWHKIRFYQEEGNGGDNYYLYWKRPGGSMEIVPSSRFFHCKPTISKVSCVISDPVNGTTRPKRIPGATIRYAFQVNNTTDDTMDNVIVEDTVSSNFDTATIRNLQIKNGNCNCSGVASASNNGANGTANGVNPIKLDYGHISGRATECGYFEVDIK